MTWVREEGYFWKSVWRKWGLVFSGAGVALALKLYERSGHNIPNGWYAGILGLCFFVAVRLAYHDLYNKAGIEPAPIAARVEMRHTHSTWSETTGPLWTWQFRVINREDAPLLLRADFNVITQQGTYTWYRVRMDGMPDNEPSEIPARGSKTILAEIDQRFWQKIPEFLKDRVKYPDSKEELVRHEMVLYDMQSRRSIRFTDKTPYDWPERA